MEDAEKIAHWMMALDDEQPDQDLKDNGRVVAVEDPVNMEVFIQRPRARTNNPKSVAGNPLPLTAQLLNPPTHEERPTKCPSSSMESIVIEDEEKSKQIDREDQIEAYHDLVNGGGRPSHPVERMDDIVSNPGEYREILSFWQDNNEDWEVFRRQLVRWLDFQRVQRLVREGPFVDEYHLFTAVRTKSYDDFIQSFPKLANGTRGFPEYVQSAKERLARNGFNRPFELNRDITKQNKLTTWIEFMNWEYMWYEKYANLERRSQWRHDEAWKTLVESGELKPWETREELSSIRYRTCHSSKSNAEQLARKSLAVKRAKYELTVAENAIALPGIITTPLQELQRRVEEAQEKVAVAEDTYRRAQLRERHVSRYINTTIDLKYKKKDVADHQILLRWILQQVPLIEQEEGIHPSEPASPPTRGGKRSRGNSNNDAPPSKKAKRGDATTVGAPARDAISSDDLRGITATSRPTPELQSRIKRTRHTNKISDAKDADQQQAWDRAKPRRSARIAEQQQAWHRANPRQSARIAEQQQALHRANPRQSARTAEQQRLNSRRTTQPTPPARLRRRRACQPQLPSPPCHREGTRSRSDQIRRGTRMRKGTSKK